MHDPSFPCRAPRPASCGQNLRVTIPVPHGLDLEARLGAIRVDDLAPFVRAALGAPRALPLAWGVARMPYERLNPTSCGLYRFNGMARDADETLPWSLVLKVTSADDDPIPGLALTGESRTLVREAFRPDRELHAYRSGLLDELPEPLAAPRCFGALERPNGEVWLWLEDVVDTVGGEWPLARYARAAEHLGRFSGVFLPHRPAHGWLSRGWLRTWVERLYPALNAPVIEDEATWREPAVRRAFPVPVADQLRRLWRERGAILAALEQLPRTLAHLDAFRSNLIARRRPDGSDETVAVDWAFVGVAALGEEVGQLVAGSVWSGAVAADRARELDRAAFDGYLRGLAEAGWRGDERLVRFGHAASAALRWGLVSPALRLALDPAQHAKAERDLGLPVAELLERRGLVTYFLLELAAEARRLLAALPQLA